MTDGREALDKTRLKKNTIMIRNKSVFRINTLDILTQSKKKCVGPWHVNDATFV